MPVNSQLLSGLMGRNYVAQPDAAELQDNYLSLKVKRNALRRQQESDAAVQEYQRNPTGTDLRTLAARAPQVAEAAARIANYDADNLRAKEQEQAGIIATARANKFEDEKLAKADKEKAENLLKQHHGNVFASLYMNPTQATLDAHLANGDITQDEYDMFNTIPSEKWKPTAAAGIIHNLGEEKLRTIDKEQSAIAKDSADIAENQAKADERKQELEAFRAQWEAKNPDKAATPADFLSWKRSPVPEKPKEDVDHWIATIATGNPQEQAAAQKKLDLHIQTIKAARPVNVNGGGSSDVQDIAKGIIEGNQPPDLRGLYGKSGAVRAQLERAGYDLTTAQRDYTAVQRHLSTLNGAQQERLRQAVNFTSDSLDQIENLYKRWQKVGPNSGFKILNRAGLAAAKQLPGEAGAVANALDAQINDLTSELGTVYKGGNGSTDQSLKLAAENLKADWNEETFNRAVNQIRSNLKIRRNSIFSSAPVGVSPDSPYIPPDERKPAAPAANRPPLSSYHK